MLSMNEFKNNLVRIRKVLYAKIPASAFPAEPEANRKLNNSNQQQYLQYILIYTANINCVNNTTLIIFSTMVMFSLSAYFITSFYLSTSLTSRSCRLRSRNVDGASKRSPLRLTRSCSHPTYKTFLYNKCDGTSRIKKFYVLFD